MEYEQVIAQKSAHADAAGIADAVIARHLFPHQRDLVSWALKRGRAALFADTGLGKGPMAIEWARHVSERGRVLILAPLAVGPQLAREAARFGVDAKYVRDDAGDRITITNYERLHRFDVSAFAGVVLDESSILKAFDGKTRNALIESFATTPFKLACTATPAPNDFTELGNHAEFLGIKSRAEMLAEYFVHDGGSTSDWRIKGHAVRPFWRWVATWGAVVKMPSDLGHDDAGFVLPPCNMHERVIEAAHDMALTGRLFAVDALSLNDQRRVRRGTQDQRVAMCAEIAGDESAGPCVIWCEMNAEADAITAAITGAVQVAGSDSAETKEEALIDFARGAIRVLVSKPSICGFGLNWQHCRRVIFAGASHSYEQTYQAIRRCWRFGQTQPVDVYVVRADTEGAVMANYRRKEADAARMGAIMTEMVGDAVRAEVRGLSREWNPYAPSMRMVVPNWIGTEEVDA